MKHPATERASRSRPDAVTLLVVAIAVLGAAHLLVRTSTYGAGFDGDSVIHLSKAESLLAGEGLEDFRRTRPSPKPPLFPLLLAAAGLAGIEPLDAGRLVNVTAFGLIVLLSGLWLRRSLESPFLVVGATLALATSYPLGYFSSFIMADAVCILFMLLALMQMEAFPKRTVVWRSLVLAAVFAALASVTRYAGIAVILTGVAMLLLRRQSPLVARLACAAFYGAISSVAVGAVFVRNHVLYGNFYRENDRIPLSESFSRTAGAFHEALIPVNAPGWLDAVLPWTFALAIPAVAAMYVYYAAIERKAKPPRKHPAAALLARTFNLSVWGPALPFAMFSFVYLTFILAAMTWGYSSTGILPRHYLPLYVSLFLLGAWLFDRFLGIRLHGWRAAAGRVSACLVLVACLGLFGLWAKRGFDLTIQALESGFIGNTFNTVQWIESETIEYLRENPIDARVFCNRFGLLHGLLALKARTGVRGKYPTLPKKLHRLTESIEAGRIEGGTWIVWLKSVEDSRYDFNDTHLRTLPGVETVAELSDGVIFHVTGDAAEIAIAPATTMSGSPRP